MIKIKIPSLPPLQLSNSKIHRIRNVRLHSLSPILSFLTPRTVTPLESESQARTKALFESMKQEQEQNNTASTPKTKASLSLDKLKLTDDLTKHSSLSLSPSTSVFQEGEPLKPLFGWGVESKKDVSSPIPAIAEAEGSKTSIPSNVKATPASKSPSPPTGIKNEETPPNSNNTTPVPMPTRELRPASSSSTLVATHSPVSPPMRTSSSSVRPFAFRPWSSGSGQT